MIRSVNENVAVQTSSTHQLDPSGGIRQRVDAIHSCQSARLQIRAAVDLRRMIAAVALLAQKGHPGFQQRRVRRAVRRVANGAILRHRFVLP